MAAIARGDRLLLRFRNDVRHVHERYVLTMDLGGEHFAVTPDRRRVLMTLGDGAVREMWLVDIGNVDRLPAGLTAAEARRPANSAAGQFLAGEEAYFNTHGLALEAWHAGGRAGPAPAFAPPPPGAPPPLPPPGAPPVTEAFVLVPVGALAVGDVMDLRTTPHHVLLGRVIILCGR